MKNNENLESNSSLKNYNFKGWTSDKIIEKYDYVLSSREKQIEDLSLEFGNVYQNLNKYTDICSNLENENNQLKNKTIKLENILQQELNNKEIMFIRLENKERECDELRSEQYLNSNLNKSPQMIFQNEQTNNKFNMEINEDLNRENDEVSQSINENISELKVDQAEDKNLKVPEDDSKEVKEKTINTKSLEKKNKIQGNASNVNRSHSISVGPSSSSFIENTFKNENINSEENDNSNSNTKIGDDSALDIKK